MKKVSMAKYGSPICPAIQDKLENNNHDSRNCFAYVIDMGARSCSCRMWDLTCILCKHAVPAIQMSRENP